jgi:A/G-specific adenine glycosylase
MSLMHAPSPAKAFASRLVAWQQRHGRHDLPWQVSDPYAVWVSEIMLQQTQVETVIPYFCRFLARFPDLHSLAAAGDEAVLTLWSGLGYYARGRNLAEAARRIVKEHGGEFPSSVEAIAALPGVGRSTAAAIAVFGFGQRHAILDGNVKRVFCRLFGIEGWPGARATENRLWELAESLVPKRDVQAYTQGLMDLGATLCRRGQPDCVNCPFARDCVAHRTGRQRGLPTPRPRKVLPERSTAMLVWLHAGQVLLEKRPPTGVWGGLWSLPECPVDTDLLAYVAGQGYVGAAPLRLAGLSHGFSHFRLNIQPVLLRASARPLHVETPGRLWMALADALQAALPAPVRTVLERVIQA